MGIPSYYKKLVDRFPELVRRVDGRSKADALLIDFNCMVYGVVRGPKMPAYPGAADPGAEEAWENELIRHVKDYIVHVWNEAGRPAQVVIAVDGVVPMAKIRQQRLRRFKSIWLGQKELEAGVRKPGVPVWDTNAITPGTAFMERLGAGLKALAAARGPGWVVSAADEPGEGEQKIMAWARAREAALAGKEVWTYGLDGDLIVLSLLAAADTGAAGTRWRLLREEQEFGRKKDAGGGGAPAGAPPLLTLDIGRLLQLLVPEAMTASDYMREYIVGMCFLGNDFLPHSISLKIRDGAHDTLCQDMAALHTAGMRLVGADGLVNGAAVHWLVSRWAVAEHIWFAESIRHKYQMRAPPPRNDTERLMMAVQNLPLEWREEDCLFQRGELLDDWAATYWSKWMRGADVGEACRMYYEGLQWVLDYYTGQPISYTWYFPWNLPPLWADLARVGGGTKAHRVPVSSPVAPQEQLAMVLPEGSWRLVRNSELRRLPAIAPQFWPQRFGFFSAGRRWMWECEAELPILTIGRLRGLLRRVV